MRYIAFLRAINVGGRTVKMERLRQIFLDAGLMDVATHIASGNVLFSAGKTPRETLETRIEKALSSTLGFASATFLRTASEVDEILARPAFGPQESGAAHAVYIGFLKNRLTEEQAALVVDRSGGNDEFRVFGSEIHWLCRERSEKSISWPGKLEKALKVEATFRNVSTVIEIAARLREPAD